MYVYFTQSEHFCREVSLCCTSVGRDEDAKHSKVMAMEILEQPPTFGSCRRCWNPVHACHQSFKKVTSPKLRAIAINITRANSLLQAFEDHNKENDEQKRDVGMGFAPTIDRELALI